MAAVEQGDAFVRGLTGCRIVFQNPRFLYRYGQHKVVQAAVARHGDCSVDGIGGFVGVCASVTQGQFCVDVAAFDFILLQVVEKLVVKMECAV